MTCACGHHHPRHTDDCQTTGTPVALALPLLALRGRLICADTAQMMTALSLLPDHVDLSRAEPGNLRFEMWQDEDPLIWHLSELFVDADAFAAHQSRTANSAWGHESGEIRRDFQKYEVMPMIRPQRPSDHGSIDALLHAALASPDEARQFRKQGDPASSLVVDAAGAILGYVAASPQPGGAVPPAVVTPKARGLGLAAALNRAVTNRAGGQTVLE